MSKKYEYIPFDSKIDRNLGEYEARLPKWTPSRKAPDGRYLEIWYDRNSSCWILQEFDKDGNEIRSQYNGHKLYAQLSANSWANEWYLELTEQERN